MRVVLLILLTVSFASARAEDLCDRLKRADAAEPNPGVSLRTLKTALNTGHSLGSFAKNSGPMLEDDGLTPIATPGIAGSVPVGAIMVLKRAGDCPVGDRYGDVALNCPGGKMLNSAGPDRSTQDFVTKWKDCVVGVMYKPGFTTKNAGEICAKMAAKPKVDDHLTLAHLRDVLREADPKITSLGDMAKASVLALEKNGFKNVWRTDEVPNNSIYVLEQEGGCPVDARAGHVAMKCGPDQLFWGHGHTKKLSDFTATHPRCIKGIYARPEAPAPAGAPAREREANAAK